MRHKSINDNDGKPIVKIAGNRRGDGAMSKHPQGNVSTVSLELPIDAELLQAAGRVALACGQLEHMLCMTVKSLSGLSLRETLDATARMSASDLREKIKRHFKQKSRDEAAKTRLDALLNKAKRLSEKRNSLIHRPWARDKGGNWVVKEEDHTWGQPPSADELNQLADDIHSTAVELNTARLQGFIKEALSAP
jgi:hypothetical protein